MRLPAYGRQFKTLLDSGQWPDRAFVIWGDDWQRLPDRWFVCLKPGEFQPKTMDFSMMAGLRVDIVDREGGDGAGLLQMAAEIGRVAAQVFIHFAGDKPVRRELSELFYCLRKPCNGVWAWPEGWSAVDDAAYNARFWQFLQDMADDLLDSERMAA